MVTETRIRVAGEEEVSVAYHPGSSDRWFVCCHGFVSDKTGSYERRCAHAAREGYHAVRFDFRGCGESDGVFQEQALSSRIADLTAVLDHYDPSWVAVYGSSFGGKVAFHAATADDRVRALVVRAPVTANASFDQARAVVERDGRVEYAPGVWVDERFFEDLERYPFRPAAREVGVPVAFFHGRGDESVPVQHTLDAAGALRTDALVRMFADEAHVFSPLAEERMLETAFAWLRSV